MMEGIERRIEEDVYDSNDTIRMKKGLHIFHSDIKINRVFVGMQMESRLALESYSH